MAEKHYCGQCVYFTRFYCPKRNKQVSYSGYTCDEFLKRKVIVND